MDGCWVTIQLQTKNFTSENMGSDLPLCCCSKMLTESNLEEKMIYLTMLWTIIERNKPGNQGRMIMDSKTEAETIEEHCLLLCFFSIALLYFLSSSPTCPGWYSFQWSGIPTSIGTWENGHRNPHRPFWQRKFLNWNFLFSGIKNYNSIIVVKLPHFFDPNRPCEKYDYHVH